MKKFEKYIIPIKPFIPQRGKIKRIKIIRITESLTAVRKVKPCWSRPFKIPSDMLSRYIKGTMGERAFKRKPISSDLYIKYPISSPKTKNIAATIKEISKVSLSILSVDVFTIPKRFFAADSDISGISKVEIELSKVDGKNKIGSAIPLIIPNCEREFAPESGKRARFLGTNTFSAVLSAVFRYLPDVMGKAMWVIFLVTP